MNSGHPMELRSCLSSKHSHRNNFEQGFQGLKMSKVCMLTVIDYGNKKHNTHMYCAVSKIIIQEGKDCERERRQLSANTNENHRDGKDVYLDQMSATKGIFYDRAVQAVLNPTS